MIRITLTPHEVDDVRLFQGTSSWLAVGSAQVLVITAQSEFTMRAVGSYEHLAWEQNIHDQFLLAGVCTVDPGPVAIEIVLTIGSGRNWV
ncbi:MAG: hypothetical protein M3460_23900 [Actinomycetota bacterium]|nr:hypothetical protein [Actinomycetota bacterium]